ncbi:MAG TPA: winged helix DNA-binding domain-containing protein [Candidatus Limnocylindrales bacterium]|nr:winged helix DNA-binding domain-containing protein [Candidatus Limnocylindrales bacterium]
MTTPRPALTERALNRATLGRQLLLRREQIGVVEAVRRVTALQAQEPASPYIALWNRVKGFAPADLDAAFAAGRIVKGTLMRLAMHAVDAADYPILHEAMQHTLRPARLQDPRFTVAALSVEETDALIPELDGFLSQARSNDDVRAWLNDRLGPPDRSGAWWALRHFGPFVHAVTGGPWAFHRRAYRSAYEAASGVDRRVAMEGLVRRYLEGFGPATPADIKQFGMLYMGPIKTAVQSLLDTGELVRLEGHDGAELVDIPHGLLPPEDAPAPPRLLGMWDEILLAYADRARTIDPGHRKHVARVNGDTLPSVLVDGRVAGIWRATDDGIEVTALERLPDDTWDGLAAEARSLRRFLAQREALPYRRYRHWWDKLPRAEVRTL